MPSELVKDLRNGWKPTFASLKKQPKHGTLTKRHTETLVELKGRKVIQPQKGLLFLFPRPSCLAVFGANQPLGGMILILRKLVSLPEFPDLKLFGFGPG